MLAGLTTLLFAVDVARLKVPAWNRLFFRSLSLLASPREVDAIASSTWYALSATLLWALVPGSPAMAGLLVLGLADPAASVVGRTWGRRPLGKGTWEGSAAFVAVALGVLTVVVGMPGAVAVAAVAAAAEVIPSGLDDNLTVPLATAAAVWALATPFLGGLLG